MISATARALRTAGWVSAGIARDWKPLLISSWMRAASRPQTRWLFHQDMTSFSVRARWTGVEGRRSSWKSWKSASKISGRSPGRMWICAWRPWRRPFREELYLPRRVRGPRDLAPLAREAAARAGVVVRFGKRRIRPEYGTEERGKRGWAELSA